MGTSMGAFVSGFYIAGINVKKMEGIAHSVDMVIVARMLAPGVPIHYSIHS
jgi:predicted acylesterase/phospholipase RssA